MIAHVIFIILSLIPLFLKSAFKIKMYVSNIFAPTELIEIPKLVWYTHEKNVTSHFSKE